MYSVLLLSSVESKSDSLPTFSSHRHTSAHLCSQHAFLPTCVTAYCIVGNFGCLSITSFFQLDKGSWLEPECVPEYWVVHCSDFSNLCDVCFIKLCFWHGGISLPSCADLWSWCLPGVCSFLPPSLLSHRLPVWQQENHLASPACSPSMQWWPEPQATAQSFGEA